MRTINPAVIASAAKQSTSPPAAMDCFASLAMTWMGRGVLDTPHSWHGRPAEHDND